jgi:hypothetical protein
VIRRTRTVAAMIAVAGIPVFGAASAHAQPETQIDPKDQQFTQTVTEMGITPGPGTDLPAVGRGVCDSLNQGLAGSVNPVPVVRGVVTSLQNSGLTRDTAVGVMRAAVAVYCPENRRYLGR